MSIFSPAGPSRPRVLLADDEEALRVVVGRILGHLGFDAFTVADGAQALARYLDTPASWDLVILDVVMPVMNGMRAYEAIRAHSAGTNVLLYSGYHNEAVGPALARDPRLRFLHKPFDVRTLQNTLADMGALPVCAPVFEPVISLPPVMISA